MTEGDDVDAMLSRLDKVLPPKSGADRTQPGGGPRLNRRLVLGAAALVVAGVALGFGAGRLSVAPAASPAFSAMVDVSAQCLGVAPGQLERELLAAVLF